MTRTSIALRESVLAQAKAAAQAEEKSLMEWMAEVIEEHLFRLRLASHARWQRSRPDLFGPEAAVANADIARRLAGGI
jgi:hypothetical protein